MKKNLVIGSGKGYDWYTWEPFVRSFLKNVKNSDLILFVDELSDFTVNQLEKVGKEIKGGNLKLESFPEDLKEGFIVNNRWKMFLRYVENHGDEYEQIFICDTRDLIFQGDIFECFTDKKNFLGYATEADKIRGERSNSRLNYMWIEYRLGKKCAEQLADKDIICCGTVIGTVSEIKIFLGKMIEYNPNAQEVGDDQITMQYIIYNNLVPVKNLIKIDCWTGAIFTSYIFHECNPVNIKDNLILRGDGNVPTVVHQYDKYERQKALVELVDRLYRDFNYNPNEKISDMNIALERFSYLINSRQFDNAFDLFTRFISSDLNLVDKDDVLIECWLNLLKHESHNYYFKILNVALQESIMMKFKDSLYINQSKKIFEGLKFAKNHDYTIIANLESWLRNSILKAVRWHLDHNNFPRYHDCIHLMINMNLTDNFCFYRLMAELCRSIGETWQALGYYQQALDYIDADTTEKTNLVTVYWHQLWNERKFFSDSKPQIIIPTKNEHEKNLIFDEKTNSFVKVDTKD